MLLPSRLIRALSLVSFPVLVACGAGTSTQTPARVDGTLAGQPFAAADAISAVNGNTAGSAAYVVISDDTGLCPLYTSVEDGGTAATQPGVTSIKILAVVLTVIDVATNRAAAPTGPSTFDIIDPSVLGSGSPSDHVGLVQYLVADQAGNESSACSMGKSGTVTLTSADGNAFAGAGDVTMDCGDRLTFQFDAAPCAALETPQGSSVYGGGLPDAGL